jgi:phosphate transport system permease protein
MSAIDEQQLLTSRNRQRMEKVRSFLGHSFLFTVTLLSATGILFILFFIFKDAFPFFQMRDIHGFFESDSWYPEADPPKFGARGIFVGSILVTAGSCVLAVPLGITAAICLSDVLPFTIRQVVKPVIELLAAIPSVAYGFFALVVFAPILQEQGGTLLAGGMWVVLGPLALLGSIVAGDLLNDRFLGKRMLYMRWLFAAAIAAFAFWGLYRLGLKLDAIKIANGVNALNASILLAIMALPTIVSVCEDSLTAVGRSLREGSYALGATRAETMTKVILPAASGGIVAAVILGIMRAIGETMVVLMAAGNSFETPEPWYDLLEGVRTLTATIALEMGETDQTSGAAHYHSLFALGFYLLVFSFVCNVISEWCVRRTKRRLKGL